MGAHAVARGTAGGVGGVAVNPRLREKMARVVPSDVVKAADRMFPEMSKSPQTFQNIGPIELPSLAALASLAAAVPDELIRLLPAQYAELMASIACLKATPDVFSSGRIAPVTQLRLLNYDSNPVALIRAAMFACPDEAPAVGTKELSFITDVDLRESIRLDMSAANTNLVQGEWKGATVLAGSATEALLLWKIQEHNKQKPGTLAAALAAIPQKLSPDPEDWVLHQYITVALQLKIITPETATQASQAKDFRNLIHPGRAKRKGQSCDRGTALAALAAAELVARDVAK